MSLNGHCITPPRPTPHYSLFYHISWSNTVSCFFMLVVLFIQRTIHWHSVWTVVVSYCRLWSAHLDVKRQFRMRMGERLSQPLGQRPPLNTVDKSTNLSLQWTLGKGVFFLPTMQVWLTVILQSNLNCLSSCVGSDICDAGLSVEDAR